MHPIDQLLINWYKKNRDHFDSHIKDLDDIITFMGWPSESKPEPYVEDLVHVLNNQEEELGVPIPPEITAHELSLWAGSKVPVDHPLVRQREKWWEVVLDGEYNMASATDEKQLWVLLAGIAKGPARKNLGSFEELSDYLDAPEHTGKIYTVVLDGNPISFTATDEAVAFLDRHTDKIKVFDYDGNQIQKDADHSKTMGYIQGVPGGTGTMIKPGALASIIGNTLASMLLDNDIGIFDLP